MNRLSSPDFWVGIACASCVMGILSMVGAMVFDAPMLGRIGEVLIAPLLMGGVGLVLVVIPILVFANHRLDQRPPTE